MFAKGFDLLTKICGLALKRLVYVVVKHLSQDISVIAVKEENTNPERKL